MKSALSSLSLIFFISVSGQNLVPNPSFELISGCPDEFYQIYKAAPWFSPDCGSFYPNHGYAVLFNSCNYGNAGVPKNAICTQKAHSGFSYAGIEVVSAYGGAYRQYLGTTLKAPLGSGKKYYFSMYFNLCDQYPGQPDHVACFNADSTGVVFSAAKIDKNESCLTIPFKPDVHSTLPAIMPGTNWYTLDGCYTAKGDEKYILIGNFGGETISNCAAVNTLAYFIFIDDVSLISEINKNFDTTLCPNETWEIDATNFREEYTTMPGWRYLWSDGDTSSTHTFNKAGNETLTVSRKDCFKDVYTFNVQYDAECLCKIFIPNAFSPNGDRLNDVFLPQITCSTIELFNYSLSLYNRWGEKVFYTTDRTKAWDGTYKGKIPENEIFAWVINYDIKKGSGSGHKNLSGTVVTLR